MADHRGAFDKMPEHATLKLIHQASALISIVGFTLRGGLMLAESALLRQPWMRIWPHFVDTLLLISGLWMAINLQLHPGNSYWLGAKLLALLAYIALGFVALRLGRTRRIRIVAFFAAIACFGYILLVATTRSPLPFLGPA
jgi:uncharacterized membrane protein SirB2